MSFCDDIIAIICEGDILFVGRVVRICWRVNSVTRDSCGEFGLFLTHLREVSMCDLDLIYSEGTSCCRNLQAYSCA